MDHPYRFAGRVETAPVAVSVFVDGELALVVVFTHLPPLSIRR